MGLHVSEARQSSSIHNVCPSLRCSATTLATSIVKTSSVFLCNGVMAKQTGFFPIYIVATFKGELSRPLSSSLRVFLLDKHMESIPTGVLPSHQFRWLQSSEAPAKTGTSLLKCLQNPKHKFERHSIIFIEIFCNESISFLKQTKATLSQVH